MFCSVSCAAALLTDSEVHSFVARQGHGGHLERFFHIKARTDLSSVLSPEAGRERGRVKCRLRMTGEEGRSIMETCAECLNTRSAQSQSQSIAELRYSDLSTCPTPGMRTVTASTPSPTSPRSGTPRDSSTRG